MWRENTRPTLYGQRLAWQITTDHYIDPAYGVEPVLFISCDDLINVIIRNKEQALKEARKY